MSLLDLAHTSQYGPNNPGSLGTGTILGINTNPLANAALGNPNAAGVQYNRLEDAAHSSTYGPFNTLGTPGVGFIPDVFGNNPAEVNFSQLPPQ
jgi:hypothetical protein